MFETSQLCHNSTATACAEQLTIVQLYNYNMALTKDNKLTLYKAIYIIVLTIPRELHR